MSDANLETRLRYFRGACVLGATAVVLGAFGAHGLEQRLSAENLEIWDTAVVYHFYHALALLAFSAGSLPDWTRRWAGLACAAWSAGTLVFSGTLYALALTDVRWLGAITPLGGVAMIFGWVFALGAVARPQGSGTAPTSGSTRGTNG